MTRLVPAALAALLLAASAPAFAALKPTNSHAPPSSFAPRPHTNQHVYGSPIEPRIVGHTQPLEHKRAPTKRSARTMTRDSRRTAKGAPPKGPDSPAATRSLGTPRAPGSHQQARRLPAAQ
jgi:hypothetical protein